MRKICVALLLVASPGLANGGEPVMLISPIAGFTNATAVPDDVKAECGLPAYQAQMVRREMESRGVPAKLSEWDEVPREGTFLRLRIEGVVSVGGVFVGHRKQVATSATLFENGEEIARSTHSRTSLGGFGAGFKSSCTVLERCADTLAKDITGWLKARMDKASAVGGQSGDPAPAKPVR